MINLKKYNVQRANFVLFLTILFLGSCSHHKYFVSKIESNQYQIVDTINKNSMVEEFIKPYRNQVNAELEKVLTYATETIDKNGEWQTPIGNLLSDITIQKSNIIFKKRENKEIDFCLLNNGGIRSIIPKGNVSTKVAYEIMPFENTAVVISLKGEFLIDIANYIISNKKPHPISGFTFTISKENQPIDILIQGKPLDINQTYYVVTSDYLANGGDNMDFFKKGITKYDVDYKIRNILIDYFKETDTIRTNNSIRIKVEQ
jgi:2',3'-cyclic-nucleotide 2'-phosphodiesterase (5'-nucleotidase family)